MTTKTRTTTTTTNSALAAKARRLQEILSGYESVLIAFSGGVDSAYLAIAAAEVLGPRALAVTADSPAIPRRIAGWRCRSRAIRLRARSDSHRGARAARISRQPREPLLLLQGRAVRPLARGRRGARHRRRHRRQQRRRSRRLSSRPAGRARTRRAQPARRSRSDQGRHSRAGPRGRPRQLERAGVGVPVVAHSVRPRSVERRLRQIEQAEDVLRDLGFRVFRVRHHDTVARLEIARSEMARALDPRSARD